MREFVVLDIATAVGHDCRHGDREVRDPQRRLGDAGLAGGHELRDAVDFGVVAGFVLGEVGRRSCMARPYWGIACRGSTMWMLCHRAAAISTARRQAAGGGSSGDGRARAPQGSGAGEPRRRSTARSASRVVAVVVCMHSRAAAKDVLPGHDEPERALPRGFG